MLELGFRKIPDFLPDADRRKLRVKADSVCTERVNGLGIAITESVDVKDAAYLDLVFRCANLVATSLDTPAAGLRFLGGAIIPKYPGEPRREWHVDWWNWPSVDTHRPMPPQIGVITYLDHAIWTRGVLEVLRWESVKSVGSELLGTQTKSEAEDTFAVACRAGDAVILDARALHAVGPNLARTTRIAITLWYLVDWDRLDETTQAGAITCANPGLASVLDSLQIKYSGSLPPTPHAKIPPWSVE